MGQKMFIWRSWSLQFSEESLPDLTDQEGVGVVLLSVLKQLSNIYNIKEEEEL